MSEKVIISEESVAGKIYLIRGHKVMLDVDLAKAYGVLTKNLKKAVRRNPERFPEDFMFELNMKEVEMLRFQIGTESTLRLGDRYRPMAFTEQGVAMHKDILIKLKELEQQGIKNEDDIRKIFEYLSELVNPKTVARPIGFQYNKS